MYIIPFHIGWHWKSKHTGNMKKQPINPDVIKAYGAIDAGVPVSEVMRQLNAVKIKGDPLEGWTGSLPFHLDRSPDAPKKRRP